ncbi:class I SAM-dependent methyltransferase [Candidatus Uhrbacteria bacterium]|nr:class I SAM-dependent methyltransferase [Candidatus Uhrbacteria bacterium]
MQKYDRKTIRILEIGCGTSEIAEQLLQKFSNIEYIGIEPDPQSARKAQTRLSSFTQASIQQGLGYDQPLQGQFDIVFSLSVLEHVKKLE